MGVGDVFFWDGGGDGVCENKIIMCFNHFVLLVNTWWGEYFPHSHCDSVPLPFATSTMCQGCPWHLQRQAWRTQMETESTIDGWYMQPSLYYSYHGILSMRSMMSWFVQKSFKSQHFYGVKTSSHGGWRAQNAAWNSLLFRKRKLVTKMEIMQLYLGNQQRIEESAKSNPQKH